MAVNPQVLKMNPEQSQFMDDILTICSTPGRGMPEFAYAFQSVNIFSVEGDPNHTMSCDDKWNVYINFDRFMNKPESYDTTVSAFAHEILHLLLDHFQRDAHIIDNKVVTHEIERIGEELEINSSLFQNKQVYSKDGDSFDLRVPLEGRIIVPGTKGTQFEDFPPNLSMEEYVGLLVEQMNEQKNKQSGNSKSESGSDSGQGSSGQGNSDDQDGNQNGQSGNGDQEDDPNVTIDGLSSCSGAHGSDSQGGLSGTGASAGEGLDEIQIESARQQVAQEVQEQQSNGIGMGLSPAISRWANSMIEGVKMPIDRVLTKFGSSAEMTKIMATRKTYSRPHRRPGLDRTMIRPTRISNKVNVALIGDTSASMGDGEGALVKGALADLTRRPDIDLNVYTFDTSVHVSEKVRRVEDVNWIGGGGTDIRVPLRYLVDNQNELKTDYAIVITDCGTPWPTKRDIFPFPVLIIGTKVSNNHWFNLPRVEDLPDHFQVEMIEAVKAG